MYLEYDYTRWLAPEELKNMQSEYAEARDKHTCECRQKVECFKMSKAGTKMFYLQCTTCGQSWRIAKAKVRNSDTCRALRDANHWEYNNKLSEPVIKRISDKYRHIAIGKQSRQQETYSNYLLSPEWRERRALVLARANYKCEGCGVNKATQVHHLTYKRIYNEMLFDLVAVCDECHAQIHE